MRRIVKLLGGLIVSTLVLASCGIPLDDEPQIIANEELPQSLQPGSTTTTSLPDRLSEEVIIFLVDGSAGDGRLMAVVRQVPVVDSGTDVTNVVLEQLLAGPTSEEQLELSLTSAIAPSGDEPISVVNLERPIEDQLVVTFSEVPVVEGSERTVAFAQLVYTLTELSGVDQVRFAVRDENGEDEDISVSTDTDEGDVRRAVGRSDFPSFLPVTAPGG